MGTGQTNQILIASNMVGVVEGLLYAHRAGLDLEEVIAAVGAGAAGQSEPPVIRLLVVSRADGGTQALTASWMWVLVVQARSRSTCWALAW